MNTRKLVTLSLSIALVTLATMVLVINLPNGGYFNIGDTLIFIFATLFGPFFGMIAGSFGAALADVLSGYAIYAPATFVIKGLEGLVVGYLVTKGTKNYLSYVVGGVIIVTGYFIYEVFLYGIGGAIPNIPLNTLQAVISIVLATVLYRYLPKQIKELKKVMK